VPVRPVVAAFDLDGTLTTRDCVLPFLLAVAGPPRLGLALARRATALVPAVVRRDRDRMKAVATAAVFPGRPIVDVERAGSSFSRTIVDRWLRPDTLATLRRHAASGADVVLVSASYAVYVRPLAEHLGLAPRRVVATELAVDGHGRCSGGLDGGNCRGDAKVERLHAWLDAHHGGRAAVELWAYGDSAGDAPMLADADHGVWVT
jgi:phosphatidylglycerophosphatase C